MNEQKKTLIKYISEWALAAMTIIVGILFIWQTISIYITGHSQDFEGEYVYSAERVGEAFSHIAPYFWIWIALIVVVYVISQFFPSKKAVLKPDIRYTLKRMKKKIGSPDEYIDNEDYSFVKKEELILKVLWIICGVFCLVGVIMAIVYLADRTHFPKADVNAEMLNMVINIFPFVIAAFVFACGITIYEGKSAKSQLPHVKNLIVGRGVQVKQNRLAFLSNKWVVLGIRVGIAALSIAFIITGIFNDGMRDVLIKAVNICTECIGLG